MPKTKKKNLLDQISSFGSLSSISSNSESSSEEQDYDVPMPKLSKKDLLELVKLQKKIQEQQQKLKMLTHIKNTEKLGKKDRKRKTSLKKIKVKAQQNNILSPLINQPTQSLQHQTHKYKVFLTGFNSNLTYQQLRPEIRQLMSPFKGLCKYKLKYKKGDGGHVILVFEQAHLAEKVHRILKNAKVFGQRINSTFLKDNYNDEEEPRKKCYECQQTGHFGRQCPIRLQKRKQAIKYLDENLTAETQSKQPSIKEQQIIKRQQNESIVKKQERQLQGKNTSKRVTRDKNRLQRIVHDNY